MSAAETTPPLRVDIERQHAVSILVVHGMLDSSTYLQLRNNVIKAALEQPQAVIVDVNDLSVLSVSAWTVFTSARWHVSTWPDVPILLVSAQNHVRRAITACGVARYVPVHPSRDAAIAAVGDWSLQGRKRARAQLPAATDSGRLARVLIAQWLTAWGRAQLIPIAGTVATVFVQNVLDHTESVPVLIIESYRDRVTVAVEDTSHRPASRHEDAYRGADLVSGLSIVSALCRAWGSTPTPSGKTVWAVISLNELL